MSKSSRRAKKSRQTSRFAKRYKSIDEMPIVASTLLILVA